MELGWLIGPGLQEGHREERMTPLTIGVGHGALGLGTMPW